MRTEQRLGQEMTEVHASREELLTAIRDILADLLDNDSLHLTETTVAEDVEDWDSINHVKLLIALESRMGFRFSANEVEGLKNVGQLIDLIQRKQS
jgi:acyl carrier protein